MSRRPDSDKKANPKITVGELESQFEEADFVAADPSKNHLLCDFCSTGVNYNSNPRLGQYLADDVLNDNHSKSAHIHNHRPFVQLATYCEECTKRMLLFPCEGIAEARLTFDLDEERIMKNVRVEDISPRDDGIPWNPKEVSEKITQVPFEKNVLFTGDLWGPENVVTIFLSSVENVDIRKLVKYDGSLDPKELGRARKSYDKFVETMQQEGFSRKAFRDKVRDE